MNFADRFFSWWLGTGFVSLIIVLLGLASPEIMPSLLVAMAALNLTGCFLTLVGKELDK